jgi:hypothetical protein
MSSKGTKCDVPGHARVVVSDHRLLGSDVFGSDVIILLFPLFYLSGLLQPLLPELSIRSPFIHSYSDIKLLKDEFCAGVRDEHENTK